MDHLNETAALISLLNLSYFAFQIFSKKVEATNTATWLMWVIIDLVLVGSTYATGKSCLLALSYTVGALIVLITHLMYGKWKWTKNETRSAIGATIASVIWQTISPDYGVIAGTLALTIAGLPLLFELKKDPSIHVVPMFAYTTLACALTLIASWPFTIGGSFLAAGGMAYNGYMCFLCLGVDEEENTARGHRIEEDSE